MIAFAKEYLNQFPSKVAYSDLRTELNLRKQCLSPKQLDVITVCRHYSAHVAIRVPHLRAHLVSPPRVKSATKWYYLHLARTVTLRSPNVCLNLREKSAVTILISLTLSHSDPTFSGVFFFCA